MKSRTKLRWFLIILLLVGGALGGASLAPPDEVTARVADISGRDYYPAVHKEITNAKESIVVVMYLFRVYEDSYPGSHTLKLLQALVAAQKRGVRVRVILGNPLRDAAGSASRRAAGTNKAAERMLSAGGVDVRYRTKDTTMHGKLIIIDGTVVIEGSHNFSDSAMNLNDEFSLLVRSKDLAVGLQKRVNALTLEPPAPRGPGQVVPLPVRFLKDRNLLPKMFNEREQRALDVFLLLWRRYSEDRAAGRRAATLDLDTMAEDLGIKNTMKRHLYRAEISGLLEKLRDEYRLIEYTLPRAENGTFRMARGGLRRPRKGTGIEVPVGYWDYGWSRTLSMKAKVAYLICLAEQKTSSLAPWWTLNLLDISTKYTHAKTRATMSEAMLELEQRDILVISRYWPEEGKDFSEKPPNMYRVKDLLSKEQIAKAWKAMEKKHGSKKLKDARRLAAMLDRPNSRETTSSFIYCIDTWGLKATEIETKEVAKLARQNPYRHVGTVIYRLKKKYGEKKDQE